MHFIYPEAPPQRPSKGPAAKIDISLPQDNSATIHLNADQAFSKGLADKPIFTHTLQHTDTRTSSENGPREIQLSHDSEPHSIPIPLTSLILTSPLASHRYNNTNSHTSTPETTFSDLSAHDSHRQSQNILPNFSLLNIDSNRQHTDDDTPNLSIFNVAASQDSTHNIGNVPLVTELLGGSIEQRNYFTNVVNVEELLSQSQSQSAMGQQDDAVNVPRFSQLLSQSQNSMEQEDYSANLPLVSELLGGNSQSSSSIEQRNYSGNVPNVTELLSQSQTQSAVEQQDYAGNVPRFSQLLNSSQSSSDNRVSGEVSGV